jgi:hypothetical protein
MISVVYVDFSEIKLDSGSHLTEITWIVENISLQKLEAHHYFVDYPGAKESERQLTNIVGGKPLVRYSAPTVLKAFFGQISPRAVVAFRTKELKELFKVHVSSLLEAGSYRTFCTYDDVVSDESEAAFIDDIILDTKLEAAKKFGNAL